MSAKKLIVTVTSVNVKKIDLKVSEQAALCDRISSDLALFF